MKNVTISMDEAVLREVQMEAGRAGVSVSRWIAEQLEARLRLDVEKAAANARLLAWLDAGPRFDLSETGKITIDRDEMYGERFRRFNDPDLHRGSAISAETAERHHVAEDADQFKHAEGKSSDSE